MAFDLDREVAEIEQRQLKKAELENNRHLEIFERKKPDFLALLIEEGVGRLLADLGVQLVCDYNDNSLYSATAAWRFDWIEFTLHYRKTSYRKEWTLSGFDFGADLACEEKTFDLDRDIVIMAMHRIVMDIERQKARSSATEEVKLEKIKKRIADLPYHSEGGVTYQQWLLGQVLSADGLTIGGAFDAVDAVITRLAREFSDC